MPPVLSETILPTTILTDLLPITTPGSRQSLSAATRRAYEGDWRAFGSTCADVEALPASSATVAAFLAAQADQGCARRRSLGAVPLSVTPTAGADPAPTGS